MAFYTSQRLRPYKGGWRGEISFKRPDGSWGKRSKVLKSTGKKDARDELDTWREEMEREARKAAGDSQAEAYTVADLMGEYIQSKSLHVVPTTVTGYRKIAANQVEPQLGELQVRELTAEQCEAWQAWLAANYAVNTERKAFFFLKGALDWAATRGKLDHNPMKKGELKAKPRGKPHPNALYEKDRARVVAFCDIDPGERFSVAFRLALMCGLREEEVCGLQWRHVDLEGKTLRIAQVIARADKEAIKPGTEYPGYSGLYIKDAKTDGSDRTVMFPGSVQKALRARLAQQQQEAMSKGVKFDKAFCYVLGDCEGKGLHYHEIWRKWSATRAALGLIGTEGNPPTYHDLRHTYATAAIAAGVDVKTVSNQMGHSDASMTLNTYASADPDASRRAADRMDEIMGGGYIGQVIEFERDAQSVGA